MFMIKVLFLMFRYFSVFDNIWWCTFFPPETCDVFQERWTGLCRQEKKHTERRQTQPLDTNLYHWTCPLFSASHEPDSTPFKCFFRINVTWTLNVCTCYSALYVCHTNCTVIVKTDLLKMQRSPDNANKRCQVRHRTLMAYVPISFQAFSNFDLFNSFKNQCVPPFPSMCVLA